MPVGASDCANAPTATPMGNADANCGVLTGCGACWNTSPSIGEVIGPKVVDTGTGGGSFTTPSNVAIGPKVVPAVVVNVMVFAALAVLLVSPAGVATTTTRDPGTAFAAAAIFTVSTVPSLFTTGLLMVTPSGGSTRTVCAFWKLIPWSVNPVSGAPTCRNSGLMKSMRGCGGAMRNNAADGNANLSCWLPANTWTVRNVWGASVAIVTCWVADLPSAATCGAPTTVRPVAGINWIAVTELSSNPCTDGDADRSRCERECRRSWRCRRLLHNDAHQWR